MEKFSSTVSALLGKLRTCRRGSDLVGILKAKLEELLKSVLAILASGEPLPGANEEEMMMLDHLSKYLSTALGTIHLRGKPPRVC